MSSSSGSSPSAGPPSGPSTPASGPPSDSPGDADTPRSGQLADLPRLLEAMVAIGTAPTLESTLNRITETAARLANCRSALIAAVAADGTVQDFATYGRDDTDDRVREELLAVATQRAADRDSAALPRHDGVWEVPIRVGEELFGHLYLAEKRDGGPFTDEDALVLRILATEAGIAIDNARLHEAARQRERWIDGSVAVTTSLLSGEGADSLTVVAEQARRLADAAAALVLLPTREGGLRVVAAATDRRQDLVGTVIPPHQPLLAPLREGQPVFVDDPASDPRVVPPLDSRFGPLMLLPLRSGGQVTGILALPRPPGAAVFTTTERTLARQFAAQAALALVLADAQRDRERLAVYEDRDRIARDLHDLVIQRLFATGVMLEGAHRKASDTAVRDLVGRSVEELDATIQEIRTAIFALQQKPTQAPSGLRTRVLREVGAAAVPLGFQPSVSFVGPVDTRVGELVTKNLVAALREALSNAYRHARASRIEVVVDATVTLPDGRDGVRLTVADDGVGMPEDGRRSGLRNLARRAESLGGACSWGPGLGEGGRGTTVTWEAPL